MIYYVIELQTNETGALLYQAFTDRNQAEAEYHRRLSALAVSEIPKAGCLLIDENGFVLKKEIYSHVKPEPDQE